MPRTLKDTGKVPNTRRKVFFGLFVFPMLIAVTMAVLLSTIVLLTHEDETPESLIAAIKTGAPSKRWQKAFELSNELNRKDNILRGAGLLNEMIHVLNDRDHYDAKTRGYMALALSRFEDADAKKAIRKALADADDGEEPELSIFLMWAAGNVQDKRAADEVVRFLGSRDADLRKTAAYVLGVLGDSGFVPELKRALEDAVADVRWNAALSLARLGDESGFEVLVQMLDRNYLKQSHQMNETQIESVMVNAIKGLGLSKRPEAAHILETVAKTDSSLKVRQAALATLEQ